jgi:hypothetical protein
VPRVRETRKETQAFTEPEECHFGPISGSVAYEENHVEIRRPNRGDWTRKICPGTKVPESLCIYQSYATEEISASVWDSMSCRAQNRVFIIINVSTEFNLGNPNLVYKTPGVENHEGSDKWQSKTARSRYSPTTNRQPHLTFTLSPQPEVPISTPEEQYSTSNVDYPLNLTGILYFPKSSSDLQIQKDKNPIVPQNQSLLHHVEECSWIPTMLQRSYWPPGHSIERISFRLYRQM